MKTSLIILVATIFFIARMIYLYLQKRKEALGPSEIAYLIEQQGYGKFLKEARVYRYKEVFTNGGDQAITLLKELIEAGRREEIFVYEHSFPSKLFMSDEICRALRNALALKTDIKIIYNEGTEDLTAFKEALKDYINISYRKVTELPDSSESPTGIQLSGDSAFRIEYTEVGHGSTFSFNQPDTVKIWKERLLNLK